MCSCMAFEQFAVMLHGNSCFLHLAYVWTFFFISYNSCFFLLALVVRVQCALCIPCRSDWYSESSVFFLYFHVVRLLTSFVFSYFTNNHLSDIFPLKIELSCVDEWEHIVFLDSDCLHVFIAIKYFFLFSSVESFVCEIKFFAASQETYSMPKPGPEIKSLYNKQEKSNYDI